MKNLLTKLSLALPSLVLATTALVAVPVFAEDGSSGSGSTTTTSSTGGTGDTTTSTSGGESQPEPNPPTGVKTSVETDTETKDRHQGALLLAELRHNGKQHTAAELKSACESHKQGLDTKFSHINTEMASFNTRIDGILSKAENYQQSNNVTVPNWDSLVAAAASANTTSDSSIAALKAITPSLDCNSTSAAQDVATFKAAALQARTDLKAYKTATHAVVKALLDAKQASQGGQQ